MGIFIARAVVAALLLTPVQQQTQTGVITGQIRAVNSSTAGIRVVAVDAQDPAAVTAGNATIVSLTQTDAAGRYRLENIPPGRYLVMAGFLESPTYYPGETSPSAARPLDVRAGTVAEGIDFTLQRRSGVRVAGKLTRDPRTVIYAEPARIQLSLPGRGVVMEASVTADGSFDFQRVPSGKYSARVFPGTTIVAVEVGDLDIENFQITIPFTVAVRVGVIADGVVPRIALAFTDEGGNTTVPRITGVTQESLTLPEGNYRVDLVQVPEGFELRSITQSGNDLTKTKLRVNASSSPEIVVTLASKTPSPWVKVSGRITGGAPGSDRRIRLSGEATLRDIETVANIDGTFEFDQVLPGTYQLTANALAASAALRMTVSVGRRDLTSIEFAIPRTVQVRGQLEADSGSPIPRFQLGFSAANAAGFRITASLQADGSFTFNVPEGDYTVVTNRVPSGYRIKAISYGSEDILGSRRITVSAADKRELRVVTGFTSPSPWVKVSGRVRGTVTSPVLLVMSSSVRSPGLEATVAADGSFEFPRVAPGQYSVRILTNPPNPGAQELQITVEDRDIAGIEIRVPQLRTLSGIVEIEGAAPIPRLSMVFVSQNATGSVPFNPRVQTNKLFEGTMPEGEYRFNSATLPSNYRIESLTYGTVDLLKGTLKIDGPPTDQLRLKLSVQSPVARVKVSGHVTGASNLGSLQGHVLLIGTAINSSLMATIDAKGNFQFPDVPSGSYTIRAEPDFREPRSSLIVSTATSFSTPMSMPGSKPMDVGVGSKDVENVELTVPATQRINGRIVSGTAAQIALRLTNTEGNITTYLRPDSNGTFAVTLPGGQYTVTAEPLAASGVAANSGVSAIRFGGVDLLQEPLRIPGASTDELLITVAPK